MTVARDVYVNFELGLPGPNCGVEMSKRDPHFQFWDSVGGWHLISNDQYRLPPASMATPFALSLFLRPPFESPLSYEMSFGCAGSPVARTSANVAPHVLGRAYDHYVNSNREKQAGLVLAKSFFDLDSTPEHVRDIEEL